MELDRLLDPGSLALLIPVLAIVAGIVAIIAKHRERMAMIERGMNPDQVRDRAKLDRANSERR